MVDTRHLAWIAIGGSALAWAFTAPSRVPPHRRPPQALQAPVEMTDVASVPVSYEFVGAFEPLPNGVVTVATPEGAEVDKALVKPGDEVKANQILALASLSTRPRPKPAAIDGRTESAHAQRLSDALGSALTAHEGSVSAARDTYEGAKREHDEKIAVARAERDRALAVPPTEVEQAEKAVEVARTTRDSAKTLADRDARALNEGWISRNQATASREAFERAQAVLHQAESKLADSKGTATVAEASRIRQDFEKVEAQERSKLEDAQRALEAAEAGGLAFPGGTPVTFGPIRRAPITGGILRKVQLKSPIAGRVLEVSGGIVRIIRNDATYVFRGKVDPAIADRLTRGSEATLPGGEKATIHTVGPSESASRLVFVEFMTKQRPPPGTTGKVSVWLSLRRD